MKHLDKLPRDLHAALHIVGGASAEGAAIIPFLLQKGYTNLTVHEIGSSESFLKRFSAAHVSLPSGERETRAMEILNAPIQFCFEKEYLQGIERAEAIFVGQNWFNYSFNVPKIPQARSKGIPLITLAELYFAYSRAPIIGVTGTNGKTTTSNLLYEILRQEKKVYLAGNDLFHPQVLHQINELSTEDYLLLELSNRQLLSLHQSPHIAVITNIEEDHLDEHGGLEGYLKAKKRIFQFQGWFDFAVINEGHPRVRHLMAFPSQVVTYGGPSSQFQIQGKELVFVEKGKSHPFLSIDEIPIQGPHNLENVLAASAAAHSAGISFEAIQRGVKIFQGVRNRLELVRKIQGVEFYNDLASTSPAATIAALRSFSKKTYLLLGGDTKGADYRPLAEEILQKKAVPLLLEGPVSSSLQEYLQGKIPLKIFKDLPCALEYAWKEAQAGDVVLLSPSGAHFYSHHMQEQTSFIKMVKKLKISKAA